ncbi:hypothetical protein AHF37_09194 [Paragonimus kellicotti]|nr:hypothetical protein AHF37_09194 [Paragonimus kellicotti]
MNHDLRMPHSTIGSCRRNACRWPKRVKVAESNKHFWISFMIYNGKLMYTTSTRIFHRYLLFVCWNSWLRARRMNHDLRMPHSTIGSCRRNACRWPKRVKVAESNKHFWISFMIYNGKLMYTTSTRIFHRYLVSLQY